MIEEYDGTIPSRTQTPDNFNANIETFWQWFALTAIPGINSSINEIVSLADLAVYDSGTTYNEGDVVIGSDGNRYPCIDDGTVGDDPVTSSTGNWGDPLAISVSDIYAVIGRQNKIIDGSFNFNLESVSGTVTLAAGEYGHTMWKAGASGCTYTFGTAGGKTTTTIVSGTLQQVVHSSFLEAGAYVLSWSGTSQGRIDSGSYGDSGDVTATVVGGSDVTVEFGTGTVTQVKLERGAMPSRFEVSPLDAHLVRYFYRRVDFTDTEYVGSGIMNTTTTTRGTHSLVNAEGMIGTPVSEGADSSYWQFSIRGSTGNLSAISFSGARGWTSTTASAQTQGEPLVLVAKSGAYFVLDSRL